MNTSKLQMCREGNHTRIDIKKRPPQKYFKSKTAIHQETLTDKKKKYSLNI